MKSIRRFAVIGLLLSVALVGCHDDGDGLNDPNGTVEQETGYIHGGIGTGDLSFEFASLVDGTEQSAFLIRGYDIEYDTDLGALVVEVTVVNAGELSYPEPVTLSFVELLPDGVTVLNADNEVTGPGAAFLCEFADDDGTWSPGEESLPRTVQFGVETGVSIAFVARIDIGMVPGGGAIGGMVWHDVDEDGEMDADEPGLADVGIQLTAGTDLVVYTHSDLDGTYAFDGLPAGHYTVTRLPRDDLAATTPLVIQVLLVSEEGEVSDFLAANFGCVVVEEIEHEFEVGDLVDAKGEYSDSDGHLVADRACLHDHDHSDDECWYRINGPVTAYDEVAGTVSVMGADLVVTDDTDWDVDDLAVGDYVHAHVELVDADSGEPAPICRIHGHNDNHDQVRGMVQEVITDALGQMSAVRMNGVVVDLTSEHDCHHH